MATTSDGVTARARAWLDRPADEPGSAPPRWRRLGLVWVAVTLPVTTVAAAFARTPGAYVVVLFTLAFGAYHLPGLPAGLYAVRRADPADRPGYRALWLGQLATVVVGAAALVALAAGWDGVLALVPAGLGVAGATLVAGLAMVVRRRSGQQALTVDVAETLAVVVAVAAPPALLAWPAMVGAEDAWFALGAGVVFLFTVAATYWVALLWVRLGPGPRPGLERSEVGWAVVAAAVGSVTAALQVAHGATDFGLPAPPLVLLTAVCGANFLLIPLHAPARWRGGFESLPPEAQVRGGWLPTVVPVAGIAALLATTAAVAGDRPGAVPFALAVVATLAVLGAVRQVATMGETRRLYAQVTATAGERRLLLAQLLERSVGDRHAVAEQLHRQAMSAYASFTAIAADQVVADRPPAVVAQASEAVGLELRRRAEALHDLVRSLHPDDTGRRGARHLAAPIRAHLATLYGDGPGPELTIDAPDDVVLDWVVETVLLQVVRHALDNVHAHARASSVRVAVEWRAEVAWARVTDDGVGFDPGAITHLVDGAVAPPVAGAAARPGGGLAAMHASTAVIDGRVWVRSRPGRGTTVVARLGPGPDDPDPPDGGRGHRGADGARAAVVVPLRALEAPADEG